MALIQHELYDVRVMFFFNGQRINSEHSRAPFWRIRYSRVPGPPIATNSRENPTTHPPEGTTVKQSVKPVGIRTRTQANGRVIPHFPSTNVLQMQLVGIEPKPPIGNFRPSTNWATSVGLEAVSLSLTIGVRFAYISPSPDPTYSVAICGIFLGTVVVAVV